MRLLSMRSLFTSSMRRRSVAGAVIVAAVTMLPGCTSRQLEGTGSSYLVIEQLVAPSGDDEFKNVLESDVLKNGSVIADDARIDFRLAMKDPGSTLNPSVPSTANWITVTRYHVKYTRADGRNTQGVDVPYEFDGAATGTVRETSEITTLFFTLVRVQSKLEPPLIGLRNQGGQVVISTIAEVTFYGFDQAGREVSVKGKMSVNFADYAG